MARFFINRPIVAMVISILMVIVGLVAILGLPIAQFPNIVPPEIQVKATYVGADARPSSNRSPRPSSSRCRGVDNMNYMYSHQRQQWADDPDVNFDLKHRSEHRPDPDPDAAGPGGIATAAGRARTTG